MGTPFSFSNSLTCGVFNSPSQGGAPPPPSDVLNPNQGPKASWISFPIRQDRDEPVPTCQVTMTHGIGGSGMSLQATWPTWQGSLENPSLMVWGCEYDPLFSMQCLKSLGSRPRPYRAWPVAERMPGLILACCPSELIVTPGLGGQGHSRGCRNRRAGVSALQTRSARPLCA